MRVVASDKAHDLALLHPDGVVNDLNRDIRFPGHSRPVFPPLAIGKHAKCEVGDTIYVVGYPQISVQGPVCQGSRGSATISRWMLRYKAVIRAARSWMSAGMS